MGQVKLDVSSRFGQHCRNIAGASIDLVLRTWCSAGNEQGLFGVPNIRHNGRFGQQCAANVVNRKRHDGTRLFPVRKGASACAPWSKDPLSPGWKGWSPLNMVDRQPTYWFLSRQPWP